MLSLVYAQEVAANGFHALQSLRENFLVNARVVFNLGKNLASHFDLFKTTKPCQ